MDRFQQSVARHWFSTTLVGEDPISGQTFVNCLPIRDSIPTTHNHTAFVKHCSESVRPPTHRPVEPMLKAPWAFNNSVLWVAGTDPGGLPLVTQLWSS